MRSSTDSSTYAAGTEIEYKPGPGLGGWRPGTVVADEGGRTVEVRAIRPGAVPLLVRRSLVRLAPAASPVDTRRAVALVQAARGAGRVVLVGGAPVAVPKPRGRLVSPRYRAYVRTWPCLSCGSRQGVQASHHGPHPVGRKADDSRCVPLCARCHVGRGGFHDTGRLLGRPELEGAALRAFLLGAMVELLSDYWFSGAEEESDEGAPSELEAPRAAGGGR